MRSSLFRRPLGKGVWLAGLVAIVALAISIPALAVGQRSDQGGKTEVAKKRAKTKRISGAKIKKRSTPGNRLKLNTLTGGEIKESTLGKVPSAANADNATHANSASGPAGGALAGNYPNPTLAPAQAETSVGALSNSWTAYDLARTPTYYKDPLGVVRLSGAITGGTVSADLGSTNVAFTLPPGNRPSHTIYAPVVTTNGAFALTPGYVGIATDGTFHVIVGNNLFVSLEGLTFRAASP